MNQIIYLEDDPTVAELGQRILSRLGFEPKHFACAQTLLDHVNCGVTPGGRYFLDNDNDHRSVVPTNPEGVSGSNIALTVLEMDPSAKIVMNSGYSLDYLPDEIQRLVEDGKVGYIQKPFTVSGLRNILLG